MSMHLKLKTLCVAVAMVAAGAVQAAVINTDNWAAGLSTGDGVSGNLFFSVVDPIANQSLILNTGLTVGQFINNNASLIDTFSTTDAGLQAFFSAHSADLSSMRWNMGAVVNGDFSTGNAGILTTNGHIISDVTQPTNNIQPTPLSIDVFTAMSRAQGYAVNYDAELAGANSATVAATVGKGYLGGNWFGTFGGSVLFNNELTGFTKGQTLSEFVLDPADPFGTTGDSIRSTFLNGQFMVDAGLGKLSYVNVSTVPVPAAAWLFGSGLVGLVGVSRRRKQI